MEKNKKNILIVLILVLIIIICYLYFSSSKPKVINQNLNSNNLPELVLFTEILAETPIIDRMESKPPDKISELGDEGEKVILIVFDKKYEVVINENDSIYTVMEKLQKDSNFTFSYKEYPSLGIFINEMNGIRGERGKYWIYSINDKEASIGVSEYIIKDGDVIKWELK